MVRRTQSRIITATKGEQGPPAQNGPGAAETLVPAILGLQRTAGNWAVSRWLARGERERMESRFGHDFSRVRVHDDASSSTSAESLHARAYTVGEDIVFGRPAAPPGSREGRRTLAHELAHVVQQRRGGGSPSLDEGSRLEQAADRAAAQIVDGSGKVAVAGAAGPGVMCQAEDDEEEAAASPRRSEKQKTQQRKQERAAAGMEGRSLSQAAAQRELRALETSYRQPSAEQRSLKRKARDLERFRRLLKLAGGTQLEKNQRQGAFDELQRTPTTTAGKPQTKHVAGGKQLPGQELRAGRDPYAQPDYSILKRRKDGSIERAHVNLKSDQIDARTSAQARATARAYVAQAVRNSRHLQTGDTIVISFARTPSSDVQEEMKREFFREGSPVGELRFGTTTHRRKDYTPPVPTPKETKATAAKPGAQKPKPTVKKPKAPGTPSSKGAKPGVSAASPTGTTMPSKLAVPPTAGTPAAAPGKLPARPPTVTAPGKLPVRPATVTAPGKLPVRPPTVTAPRGSIGRGGSGMGRGGRAEGAAALVEAIVLPIVYHYLQEHYAEQFAEAASEEISKAIEKHRPRFEALIESRREEIQAEQAEGRYVTLHVAVDTNWQDTDLGTVLTKAEVGSFELVFEGGPPPKKHSAPSPGGRFGWLVRELIGTTLSYEIVDIVLEGTDPVARERRLARSRIAAQLETAPGKQPVEFEQLILDALTMGQPLDELRDYASSRRELAGTPSNPDATPWEAAYWARMVALIDGPLDRLIVEAKAKAISLRFLRLAASYRLLQASQAGDAGTGPAVAEYWSEVIRLIDSP
jgi:hypothetical protein